MRHPGLVYTSPTAFTLRERLTLRIASPAIAWSLRALCASSRTTISGQEHLSDPAGGSVKRIIAFWHESLGLAAWCFRNTGYHTLTSYSFDGELAARVVDHFGLHALRGSSSRGGARALVQMQRAFQFVDKVGFTLDGPKGPRREAKPGVAILSLRSGIPVVPNAYVAVPSWRMRSWDRLMVPKPFSRIACAYGEPIPPPSESTPEAIEATRLRVEQALNALQEKLERELGLSSPAESTTSS